MVLECEWEVYQDNYKWMLKISKPSTLNSKDFKALDWKLERYQCVSHSWEIFEHLSFSWRDNRISEFEYERYKEISMRMRETFKHLNMIRRHLGHLNERETYLGLLNEWETCGHLTKVGKLSGYLNMRGRDIRAFGKNQYSNSVWKKINTKIKNLIRHMLRGYNHLLPGSYSTWDNF